MINCYEIVSDITVQFETSAICSLVLRRGFLIQSAILVIIDGMIINGALQYVSIVNGMKENIKQYNKEDSNVHCAMTDFSNTFDEINHDTVLDKLLKSRLPEII